MRPSRLLLSLSIVISAFSLLAQDAAAPAAASVPRLVQFSGTALAVTEGGPVRVKFALYADQTGGTPLWSETQTVSADSKGRYAVLLGAATEGGLPQSVFSSGEAKWLGVTLADAEESPRVVLVSTPYALKAEDAATLGGHAAGDFAPAPKPNANSAVTTISGSDGVLINTKANSSAGGPTVALSLDSAYLGTLGNSLYALKTAVVSSLAGTEGVTVTHNGTAYTAALDGTFLGNLATSCCAVLANNNTLTGTNTFTKPITFAAAQTFPGVATLSGADNFTGALTANGSGNPQISATTTASAGTAITGTSYGTGITAGVSGFGAYGGYFQTTASSGGYGVVAQSTFDGMYSASSGGGASAAGLYALNSGAGAGSGVIAVNGAASGIGGAYNGAAIWADSNLAHGAGSGAEASLLATALNNYAFVSFNNGTTPTLYAQNTTGPAMKVYAGNGYGIYTNNQSDTLPAAWAVAGSASSTGASWNGYGFALWADTGYAESATASYGALLATADNNFAGILENNSSVDSTLFVHNSGSAGTGADVPLISASGNGGACGINSLGDVTCSGRLKAALTQAGSDRQVEVYAVQSPENWIEDFGSGKLENGAATVAVEENFARIVNTGVQYHVFLTPRGECEGLYIANQTAGGFEVRELHHGTSAIEFDYRIVAKRAGHESERLADATAEMARINAGPGAVKASAERQALLPPSPEAVTVRSAAESLAAPPRPMQPAPAPATKPKK